MEARTKRIVISLTPTEKGLLIQVAEYEGRLSLTATIRHLIMEAARVREISALSVVENKKYEPTERRC